MKRRLFVINNIKVYLRHIRGDIIGLVILSFVSLPINLISPKFFQIFIDDVMYKNNISMFVVVAIGMFSVFLIRCVLDYMSLKLGIRVQNSFIYRIRKDVFEKYIRAPFSFIEKKDVGELKMRLVDDIDVLGNFIGEQVIDYIYGFILLVLTLILSIKISWQMTLLSILIVPFIFAINALIGKGTKLINEEIRQVNCNYFTSTHNSLQYWREIKAHNSEELFIIRFRGFRNILAKLGIKSMKFWAYNEVFSDFKGNYLTRVLVYIIGAFFVSKHKITVGALLMFSEYFSMLFSAMEGLNLKRISLNINEPYYKRVFDTFSFPEENRSICVKTIENGIKFENVWFEYSTGFPVLKNVDLKINKGDYIAIVGKTGCGKTTLLKLLLGMYEKQKGRIMIDGIDIDQINRESLSSIIGVVMQDNYLFNLSIRENMLLSNENATENDMIEACKKANIYDFVSKQPEGFDTVIGERGVKLSGGQKQRISIAAALLRKPQILIFDEATSSLDKQSEDIINDSINNIAGELTVIVIAHKPATVLRAKKIVVMDDGIITAQGSHDELIKNNDYYRKMVERGM